MAPSLPLRSSLRSLRHGIEDSSALRKVTAYLPPLNFITVHYTYFISVCLVTSLIFYGMSTPTYAIGYTDSLFLVVSAMTEAGLNTVNLSQMTTGQQFLLWLLILIGSSIFVSISTVLTRKRVFESRFKGVVRRQRENRQRRRSVSSIRRASTGEVPVNERLQEQRKVAEPFDRSGFESRHSGPRDPTPGPENGSAGHVLENVPGQTTGVEGEGSRESGSTVVAGVGAGAAPVVDEGVRPRRGSGTSDRISVMRYAPEPPPEPLSHRRILSFVGVGAHPNSTAYRLPNAGGLVQRGEKKVEEREEAVKEGLSNQLYPHYLTRHTTGRNAQFFGLSRAEREHLGGVEYRAITLLGWVVPIYFVLWQLLGCLGLGAYTAHHKRAIAEGNGINPWWLGAFNAVSAFNNSGMSLLDANMIPFQTSVYTLITMGLLILAGNTAYPLFLRLILWSMLKLLCAIYPSPDVHPEYKATLRFVLRYPRRVYTNLFPSQPTWWLLFMVVILNGIDWAAFELLNIGNPATDSIPSHYRVLDGLFQALAVRSGGFYVVNISTLRIGLQVLYIIMMYISVYPVVITMRHSNVYEERSLGIYADEPDDSEEKQPPKLGSLMGTFKRTLTLGTQALGGPFSSPSPPSSSTGTQFIRQQVRGQLAHDLWWLVLAILFISCIEVSNFDRDPVTYSVFNIAFEVVSGYGCVGISTGLPSQAYSFCGGWHKASKVILCAVMLRGRHRGLPVALDRAVRLPDDREPMGGKEEVSCRLLLSPIP
ncbi:cation transport protein-domain-containing protein [Hyaloscypha sp. PMI_1271]|nr:cation transport protein-domain-containing protein [Hyaloscypha sp. PMI_1271]